MNRLPFSAIVGATIVASPSLAAYRKAALPPVAATPPPTPPPIDAPPAMTPQPDSSMLPPTGGNALPALGAPAKSTASRANARPAKRAQGPQRSLGSQRFSTPRRTDYTHFQLTEQGAALTGTYLDAKEKQYPLVGTVDGQDVRLIVSLPNGTTLLLEGKLDGTTDMVGMLTSTGGQLPLPRPIARKRSGSRTSVRRRGGVSQPGGYTPP